MRAFCIPGIFFIFSAFVLLFIVSISLPFLTAIDITRVHTNGNHVQVDNETVSQLRLGIWSYCSTLLNGNEVCSPAGHGYSVSIKNSVNNSVTIGSSWTIGLAIHPVACGVAFIALLLSFSPYIAITLFASLASFLGATLTLIAFAIDIALFAGFKNQMDNLGFGRNTITGPGFWLAFVSLILLIFAGFIVCCGRRRDRMANATTTESSPPAKTGIFSKFRRN